MLNVSKQFAPGEVLHYVIQVISILKSVVKVHNERMVCATQGSPLRIDALKAHVKKLTVGDF